MHLHFLSGIPRSGSTLLAAILNQNPATHVSTTSGLVNALDGLATTWANGHLLNTGDPDRETLVRVMRSVIQSFYEGTDASTVIDKSRGWQTPVIIHSMRTVLGRDPKIIATVRSVPECAASFVRVAKPDDLDDFIYNGQLMDHLKSSYLSLQEGYQTFPECFLLVEYDDLIANPRRELDRVHEFLGLEPFDYSFENVDGESVKEDDDLLHGYAGMHDIGAKVERRHDDHPKDLLKHHYSSFCQPEFWLPAPRTSPELHDLDLQLAASTTGNFEEGWRLAQKLMRETPTDPRVAYNASWYYLRQGDIPTGYSLMERGRLGGHCGNPRPDAPTPMWDGRSKGTVLLNLECGLGDQIHQVRYARDIAARGCKVVVSCTGPLASLFVGVEGVSAVCQHEGAFGVYHDFWVPGMGAPHHLGLTLDDLRGDAYIPKPMTIKGRKPRIGLRWQGSSKFEDQHHKRFPYDLMFNAIKGIDAEFVSLQRDEGEEARPFWMRQMDLGSWDETQKSIASCDLVISSCTSVSHLSAAMGIPTWVVIPVMPYYLYAIDGPETPYYDAMRLFRQTTFGEWSDTFLDLRKALQDNFGLGGDHAVLGQS